MDSLTPELTQHSISSVRFQIEQKNSSCPFLANSDNVLASVTDYDHHPYSRWFRGVYYFPDPIVAEREAGYRKTENHCYHVIRPYKAEPQVTNCFEPACTLTKPCHLSTSVRYTESEAQNRATNNMCIVQYR